MSTYPDGVYAGFCAKQASSEEAAKDEPEGDLNEDEASPAKIEEASDEKLSGLKKKNTLMRSRTMKTGEVVEVELSPEEVEMFDEVDFNDKASQEKIDTVMTDALKEGAYARLSDYNTPKYYFIFALMAVFINACAQPIFGGFIMSRLLVVLSAPPEYLLVLYPNVKPELKIKEMTDLASFPP